MSGTLALTASVFFWYAIRVAACCILPLDVRGKVIGFIKTTSATLTEKRAITSWRIVKANRSVSAERTP